MHSFKMNHINNLENILEHEINEILEKSFSNSEDPRTEGAKFINTIKPLKQTIIKPHLDIGMLHRPLTKILYLAESKYEYIYENGSPNMADKFASDFSSQILSDYNDYLKMPVSKGNLLLFLKNVVNFERFFPSFSGYAFKDQIIALFKDEIERTLKKNFWCKESKTSIYITINLEKIYNLLKKKNNQIYNSIIKGYFDKRTLNLDHSLIYCDEGGLYALLNSKSEETENLLGDLNVNTKIFIDTKRNITSNNKIILGEGTFGKVRIAFRLDSMGKDSESQIFAIKKTNIEKLSKDKKPLPYFDIVKATLDDYFTRKHASSIKSPKYIDMKVIILQNEEISYNKKKGYGIMELFPRNSGDKIFQNQKYQQWKYQKPFIVQIFSKVKEMFFTNFKFYSDLKLRNTLYDPESSVADLIDVGACLSFKDLEESHNFTFGPRTPLITNVPPEIEKIYDRNSPSPEKGIDLEKALVYICGVTLELTLNQTDINADHIIAQMKCDDPSKRITMSDVISKIESLDPNIMEDSKAILEKNYISVLKLYISDERHNSNLVPKENLKPKFYVKKSVTEFIYNYKEPGILLQNKLQEFFSKNSCEELLLLLGESGSGKSEELKREFHQAVKTWSAGQPLPLFIDTIYENNIGQYIKRLNDFFGTGVTLEDHKFAIFIDSIDQVSNLKERPVEFVNELRREIKKPGSKIIIASRPEVFQSDNIIVLKQKIKLVHYYIVPFLNNFLLDKDFDQLLEEWAKFHKYTYNASYYRTKIEQLDIKEKMINCFMFNIIMDNLELLDPKKTKTIDIYSKAIKLFIGNKLQGYTKAQSEELMKFPVSMERDFGKSMQALAENISFEMFKTGKCYLNSSELKKMNLGLFTEESVYVDDKILKLLPLNIEKNVEKEEESFDIVFKHDSFKEYFIASRLISELKQKKNELISFKVFSNETQLMKFLAEMIQHEEVDYLKTLIFQSKTNKSRKAIISASNAISILVAAKYCLSNLDFSGIEIEGANLKGGIFEAANFKNANLKNINFHNAFLKKVNFSQAILEGVEFGVYPTLHGHQARVNSIVYSEDGKYLVSAAEDKCIKLWDMSTFKCRKTIQLKEKLTCVAFSYQHQIFKFASGSLEGAVYFCEGDETVIIGRHRKLVSSVLFGSKKSIIISGSWDSTIKIWDINKSSCLKTLEKHSDRINSLALCPTQRFLASSSSDKTVIIWDLIEHCHVNLLQHSDVIFTVAFDKKGERLLSGSADASIKIWDPFRNECLKTLTNCHNGSIINLEFFPDGKRATSSSQDGTVIVWDLRMGVYIEKIKQVEVNSIALSPDGKTVSFAGSKNDIKIVEVQVAPDYKGSISHSSSVNCVIFSPDGKKLISGSADKTIRIWNIYNRKCLQKIEAHENSISGLCLSLDGKYLVSCSSDKTIKIWNFENTNPVNTLTTSSEVLLVKLNSSYIASAEKDSPSIKLWTIQTWENDKTLNGHLKQVNTLDFSRDENFLASGSSDKEIKIWNINTEICIDTLKAHKSSVSSVKFNNYGDKLLTGSEDGELILWEVHFLGHKKSKPLKMFSNNEHKITGVLFSSHSDSIIAGFLDGEVIKWDLSNDTSKSLTVGNLEEGIMSLALCPMQKRLAAGKNGGSIHIWSASSKKLSKTYNLNSKALSSLDLSHDSELIACGSIDRDLFIINTRDDKKYNLRGFEGSIYCLKFSKDGSKLFTAGSDKRLRMWFADTGEYIQSFEGHTELIKSFDLHTEGKLLISCSWDKTIKIWSISTSKCIKTIAQHDGRVNTVSISSDGKIFASGSSDKNIKIWSAADPFEQITSLSEHTEEVNFVCFNCKGDKLLSASSDKRLVIWNLNSKLPEKVFSGHKGIIFCAAFSHDGTKIASGSSDKTVCLWDINKSEPISVFRDHADFINGVLFSDDGNTLISISQDKKMISRNITSGNEKDCEIKKFEHAPLCFCICENGNKQAYSLFDGSVQIFLVSDPRSPVIIYGQTHKGAINSVIFGPIDNYLCSGSDDKTIKVWDFKTKQCVGTLIGHLGAVLCLTTDKEKFIISGSVDKSIRIWDLKNNFEETQVLLGHSGAVLCLQHYRRTNINIIASGSSDNSIMIWDIDTMKCIQTLSAHKKPVNLLDFSSEREWMLSGSQDKSIKIWNARTWKPEKLIPLIDSEISSASLSKDGYNIALGFKDKSVKIWNMNDNQFLKNEGKHLDSVRQVKFSANGYLVSLSSNQMIKVWRSLGGLSLEGFSRESNILFGYLCISGTERMDNSISFINQSVSTISCCSFIQSQNYRHIQIIGKNRGCYRSIAISSDFRYIAIPFGLIVKIIEISTGNIISFLRDHQSQIISLAFSPDNNILVTTSLDSKVRMWDWRNNSYSLISCLPKGYQIYCVAFSNDGSKLAVGGLEFLFVLKLLPLQSYQYHSTELVTRNTEVTKKILSLAFSNDDKYIAYGNREGRVEIIHLNEKRNNICLSSVEKSPVVAVMFTEDSSSLLTMLENGKIKLLKINPGKENLELVQTILPIPEESLVSVIKSNHEIVLKIADNQTKLKWQELIGYTTFEDFSFYSEISPYEPLLSTDEVNIEGAVMDPTQEMIFKFELNNL